MVQVDFLMLPYSRLNLGFLLNNFQRQKALEKIHEEMEKMREEQKEEYAERIRERIQRLREKAERRHRWQQERVCGRCLWSVAEIIWVIVYLPNCGFASWWVVVKCCGGIIWLWAMNFYRNKLVQNCFRYACCHLRTSSAYVPFPLLIM